jgi:hypothetical protein
MKTANHTIGMLALLLFDDATSTIGASVIDEDQLTLQVSSIEYAQNAFDESWDIEFLVEAWGNDGQDKGMGIGLCHGVHRRGRR